MTRRTDCWQPWLWQMTICMTMAASKLLLASYGPNTKRWRWENGSQAGGMTWKITRRQVIRPRKELDPQSLHIGRMDLVIEGCSRGSFGLVRCCGRTGRAARMGTARSTPRALDSAKGRSIGLSYAEMAASSTGWEWWVGFRAGLD